MSEAPLRALPAVDRVLRAPAVEALLGEFDREAVLWLVRRLLGEYRSQALAGRTPPGVDEIAAAVAGRARHLWSPSPRPVINATGVILHTNLGRAPLSSEAVAAMAAIARYSSLELDLETGGRGSRQTHAGAMIEALTGAESAHVATNNAAAVLLALAALARGKEVLVSRGQAVEIGGGFRIPVILRQSGARLVEVGTTNRTRLSDYESAITPRTAAILHVHSSNFRIVGFTAEPEPADLADLAHRHDILFLDDNGSGALLDTARFGLRHEPMPRESIAAGADLVAFSADKLLGGPQAGILAGRADLVARVARHPLARVTRPDKATLAALAATLRAYLRGTAEMEIPVWQMIAQTPRELRERSEAWQAAAARAGVPVELLDGESTVGGGSLPDETLPTTLLALPSGVRAASLRCAATPVVARTAKGRVVLDLRTVFRDQEEPLLWAVQAALTARHKP